MSKNDMVMVPRELAEAILGNAAQGYFSKDHGDALRDALKAEQHQGSKYARMQFDYDRGFTAGTAEVNTLRAQLAKADNMLKIREEQNEEFGKLIEDQHAQLAERDALLVRVHQADALSHNCGLWRDIDAALPASAEQKAKTPN